MEIASYTNIYNKLDSAITIANMKNVKNERQFPDSTTALDLPAVTKAAFVNPAHAKVLQISYQQVRTKSEKREGILGLCSSLFPSKDCHKDNDIYTTWYVV